MKSRNARRILLTAVMALVLGALLAVSSFAAIGLTKDGHLTGLKTGKTYTATPYDVVAGTTGTAQSVNKTTDFDDLEAGIWGISDGTTTEYVFVKGAESGQLTYWANNAVVSGIAGDKNAKGLTTGKWTRGKSGSYKATPITVDDTGVVLGLGTATTQKVSLSKTELFYGLTNAQVIPAKAFDSWTFSIAFPTDYATGYSAANLDGTVTFYVKNVGDTEATAITAPLAGKDSGSVTIAAPAALKASEGYIVGIGFQPWANWTDGTNLYTGKNQPVTIVLNKGVNAFDYTIEYAEPEVEVTGVTLDKTTLDLTVGDQYQFTATVLPANATEKAVTWSISGDAATVENGNVVAVKAGNATVTVTTLNGKTATCAVTVTAEVVLPHHEGLGINLAGTIEGLEAGKTYTIQSFDIIEGTKGAKNPVDASTVIEPGLWYVSNDEKGGYVFVDGEKSGEITYWNTETNKPLENQTNTPTDTIVPGKWTRSSNGAYTTITNYFAKDSAGAATGKDQTICLHFNKPKFLKKADGASTWEGSTPIIGDDNKLQESVVYYGFTAEQVVPANKVKELAFNAMTIITGACTLNTGKTTDDVKGTFTYIVYDPVTGETTNHVVNTVGQQKVMPAAASMATSEGYVIGFAFAPFANSDDDILVCNAADYKSDNGYAHVGLKAGVNKLTLKGSSFPAPEGISVVDGKVTGLVDGKYYQYAPVTMGTDALTIGDAVKLDANATPEGFFVVRETNATATNYTAWTTNMMYIRGSSINNIFHTEQVTGTNGSNAGKLIDVPVINNLGGPSVDKVGTDVFVPGKWSGFAVGRGLQMEYGYTPLTIGSTTNYLTTEIVAYINAADAAAKAEKLEIVRTISNGIYFTYGYEPDEIIPMKDWDSYKFKVAKRQGGITLTSGTLKTKVTLFVVTEDGQIEQRSALYDAIYSAAGSTITTKQSDFADNSGYIVGIKIQPYFATEDTVITPSGAVACDYNIILMENTYKLVLRKQDKPTDLYIENGVIKGLDANKTYAWAYQYVDSQGTSNKITGKTEIEGLTGLVGIMVAGDGITTNDSDPVLFYIKGAADGRANIGVVDGGKPAYKTASEWIPGTWTGSYLSWHDQATGAYCFLDQTAGIGAGDAQKLWLYQNTKEEAQARLDADAAKSAAEGVPPSWTTNKVTSNPARLQAVIDSHYAAADYAETLEANLAAHKTLIATGLESRYIQYAYDETEIIPVSDLVEMSFTSKSRQTDYTFTATPKAIFYVMGLDGVVTEYSAMGLAAEYKMGTWIKTTIDVQAIENWPTDGYVVAVRFYPLGDVQDETVVFSNNSMRVDASNIGYSFTQHHIATGYFYTPYTGYVIKAEAEAPTFEVTANNNGEGYDVTIANFSTAATYEWQKKGDATWTVLDAGVKTFTVAETGTYTVKLYGELILGEAMADVVVDKLTPVAPTLKSEVNTADNFKVTITNASKLYTYEYKAAADSEWTPVDGTSFVVGATGVYNVRATGEVWNGYAEAEIEVVLVAPATHKVAVIPGDGEEFTITIKGYSELYTYEYKLADATEWTTVDGASFVINAGGDYVLRAGGFVYDGWAETSFRAVAVPAEIKAIALEKDKITGLDAAKAYEFANVNYLGVSETWTAIPSGTEYTFENPGLYAIRLAETADAPASTAMVFNVVGSIAQRGTIINLETMNYSSGTNWNKDIRQLDILKFTSYDDRYNPQFVVGRWSGWKVGDLAYWAQDWVTALGSTDSYIPYANLGAKLADGSMTQDEAKNIITSYVFNYAYEDGEIIPFADVEKFSFRTGARQGHLYAQGDVYTKVVVYIANDYGEVETRELLLKADYTGVASKTTHTISAADFEDTTGYIVAIQIYPFGYIPETTTLKVSDTVGQDYETKLIDYTVKLPKIDAPTNLTYNEKEKVVEGFDPILEYYYAPYGINGVGETKYFTGDKLSLDAGLWGVGIVSTNEEYADSLPYIVYVKGDKEAKQNLYTVGENGYYVVKSGDIWEPGVWTGLSVATHSTFGTNGLSSLGGHHLPAALAKPLKNAIAAGDAAAEAAARQAIANAAAKETQFKYAYANEEVVPANEVLNFEFTVNKRQGSINLGDGVTARVTFYVVDNAGNVSSYVWEEATSTTKATSHNVDVAALLEGVDGYVVAVEVNPWTKVVPENITITDDGSVNTMALLKLEGYTLKAQPDAPVVYALEAPSASGKGEIANLNEAWTYQYRLEGTEEWTTVSKVSSIRLPAGVYEIRVAETRETTVSDATVIEITKSDVERKSLQNETKKIHLPNDFIEISANYEIDTTTKIWIARLALDNIKTVAPESTITITGDGYKYVILASNIATDKAVHYYNLDLSFDGESRYDTSYDELYELAGEAYITEFFTESIDALPFEKADLYIEVGADYDGQEVELRSYNERIGKLRKVETASVEDGWVMFTNFGQTFVILKTE